MTVTFKDFLVEAPLSIEQLADDIIKNCQPFIRDVGPKKIFRLWRGLRTNKQFMAPLRVNKNRKPVDSTVEFHKMLDDGFYKAFGHKFRSQSIMAVADVNIASSYTEDNESGTIYNVLPVGNYTACWSNQIDDLYSRLHNETLKMFNKLLDADEDFLISFLKQKYPAVYTDMMKRGKGNAVHAVGYFIDSWFYHDHEESGKYTKIVNAFLKAHSDLIVKFYGYKVGPIHEYLAEGQFRNEIMIDCDKYYAVDRRMKDKKTGKTLKDILEEKLK